MPLLHHPLHAWLCSQIHYFYLLNSLSHKQSNCLFSCFCHEIFWISLAQNSTAHWHSLIIWSAAKSSCIQLVKRKTVNSAGSRHFKIKADLTLSSDNSHKQILYISICPPIHCSACAPFIKPLLRSATKKFHSIPLISLSKDAGRQKRPENEVCPALLSHPSLSDKSS